MMKLSPVLHGAQHSANFHHFHGFSGSSNNFQKGNSCRLEKFIDGRRYFLLVIGNVLTYAVENRALIRHDHTL
jgi:hypothetical protein